MQTGNAKKEKSYQDSALHILKATALSSILLRNDLTLLLEHNDKKLLVAIDALINEAAVKPNVDL